MNLRAASVIVVPLALLVGGCTAPGTDVEAQPRIRTIEADAVYAVYAGDAVERGQRSAVQALGIRTVLDLDQEQWGDRARVSNDHAMARARGALFVHLPLDPMMAPSLSELNAAVDVLRERRFHPVLVQADHSGHRTRLVVAAYRVRVQRWTPEHAAREMARDAPWAPWLPAWRARLLEYAAVHATE